MNRIVLTNELLHAALSIAKRAGEKLLTFYYRDIDSELKQDNTPVTAADLAVSHFLVDELQALTPGIPVLSEESGQIDFAERSRWEQYWLVDPLDGTQQFLEKTDQFSVLIALMQDNKPTLGIVYSPVPRLAFYAMENSGAYKQQNGVITRLRTQPPTDDVIRIAVGKNIGQEQVLQRFRDGFQYHLIRYGSSGLKGALVAEGRCDCYIRLGKTGEWDTAAVECLLRETGGKIIDLQGNPLRYNQRESLINPDFIMLGNAAFPWQKVIRFQ
ncbi:3'-5'-bisphosphate nucleotidase [Chelonobacter oris]|uniref:3'(2'),5'-bisphosphate nucleotidase CysQ n=1 Tax=Chelonobacter oris TaxID=505317 RepID=A0A0A3ALZ8_9PAST|nr:3'(2'),5'-bisphosphate nucleotidase CysQ [Chelonobacter oris]KGQ70361.1 3'-5'-bisphosphate nucleotidase [Chelonobacter oris]